MQLVYLFVDTESGLARTRTRLAMDYLAVKLVHQCAVAISLTGFFARGLGALTGATWVNSRPAKTLPHIIDTVLLVSAVTLVWNLRISAGTAPWLLAKVLGLVVYVVLGVVALRPGRPAVRGAAWVGAVGTAAWIVSVAVTKNPLGYFGVLYSNLSR